MSVRTLTTWSLQVMRPSTCFGNDGKNLWVTYGNEMNLITLSSSSSVVVVTYRCARKLTMMFNHDEQQRNPLVMWAPTYARIEVSMTGKQLVWGVLVSIMMWPFSSLELERVVTQQNREIEMNCDVRRGKANLWRSRLPVQLYHTCRWPITEEVKGPRHRWQ